MNRMVKDYRMELEKRWGRLKRRKERERYWMRERDRKVWNGIEKEELVLDDRMESR
jgi:hypothetical protein